MTSDAEKDIAQARNLIMESDAYGRSHQTAMLCIHQAQVHATLALIERLNEMAKKPREERP